MTRESSSVSLGGLKLGISAALLTVEVPQGGGTDGKGLWSPPSTEGGSAPLAGRWATGLQGLFRVTVLGALSPSLGVGQGAVPVSAAPASPASPSPGLRVYSRTNQSDMMVVAD